MKEHDPRCQTTEGIDQKVLDGVAKYGWFVMKVLEQGDNPGWAYSIGLYKSFAHPEVLVFGLDVDTMHSIINTIGEEVRRGKTFAIERNYSDLVESYPCTFKPVQGIWYPFLGFAQWFYDGDDFPVLQCFWPDFDSLFPWQTGFNEKFSADQPLLFYADAKLAHAEPLLGSINLDDSQD
jgi:hypothetical protein